MSAVQRVEEIEDVATAPQSATRQTDQGPPVQDCGTPVQGTIAQFVSFAIDDEYYCVDIIAVREIKGWTSVTKLPNQPEYVRGVLNLRGVVVPIIDLRCKFGLGLTDATPTHVVIIVQIETRLVGLLVDRVSDILQVETERFQAVPEACGLTGAKYLSGLVTVNEQMIALLELDHLAGPASGF
ncbi:MAG: chemotaxis protein CheW [Alphaproteobacteria bacterium]